jgi:release factor glutamine methyltransferase
MKFSKKLVFYNNSDFHIFRHVYEPAEDTFLAADSLSVNKDDNVLDMGTGCGILAIIAAKKASKVVATDINPHAVHCAQFNVGINHIADKLDLCVGDLFQPIQKNAKFNLILFNAPYLPSVPSETKSWIGRSWAGGPTGRQLIDRFILEVPSHMKGNGKILLVQSSLANIDETLEKFRKAKFKAKVVAEEKFDFETIVVIQAIYLFKKHEESLG